MKNTVRLRAILLFCLPLSLAAQESSSNLNQKADELLAAGKPGDAAELYEAAAKLSADNPELLYKAAENYYQARDYRRAAECFGLAKDEYRRYELAGLRHARSLKQAGRCEEAIEVFKQFARQYRGDRKAQVLGVVTNEIKGCELALEMKVQRASPVLPVNLKILPEGINSRENEFSPLPFSDNLLYFSTIAQGRVKLMRTQLRGNVWQLPTEARGLPESAAARFGTGSFSPDGKRFYCTQCTEPSLAERGGNGLRTRCSLYMLRRSTDGSWGEPERLRSYINLPDHTVLHPFVTQERGREVLFFASDREGGFGGLDLYVCERPLDSDDLDFSFPQNLGATVNTAGDEITPFFDPGAQTLWFSSNSHISIGGLDVFKSVRAGGKWSKPENAGMPVNSPADDFFFTLKKSGSGFLVSNRSFGNAKTGTRDEDIFEFYPKEPPVALAGRVLDGNTKQALTDCMVALYELGPGNARRLIEIRPSERGDFQFSVLPDNRYLAEVSKEGYETTSAIPVSYDNALIINMKQNTGLAESGPLFTANNYPAASPGLSVNTPPPPFPPGQYPAVYKIHLEVLPDFIAQTPRYEMARNFGTVTADPLPEQGIVRVLLGDFTDQKSANEVANALRKSGSFPQAFVIKQ